MHAHGPLFCGDHKIVASCGGRSHFSHHTTSQFQPPPPCHPLLSLSRFVCHRWKTWLWKKFLIVKHWLQRSRTDHNSMISSWRNIVTGTLKKNSGPRCLRLPLLTGVIFHLEKERRKVTQYTLLKENHCSPVNFMLHLPACLCLYVCLCLCMFVCMHVYMCVFVCMWVYVHVCVCVCCTQYFLLPFLSFIFIQRGQTAATFMRSMMTLISSVAATQWLVCKVHLLTTFHGDRLFVAATDH